MVTFSLTVAGDVSSFDEADFKSKLATFLGVEMSEMSIQVSSASVKVDVSITTADTAKASAVETKVTQSTPAVFSSARCSVKRCVKQQRHLAVPCDGTSRSLAREARKW